MKQKMELLDGNFNDCFLISPRKKIGEDFQFDGYFSDGLKKPPTRKCVGSIYPPSRMPLPNEASVFLDSRT